MVILSGWDEPLFKSGLLASGTLPAGSQFGDRQTHEFLSEMLGVQRSSVSVVTRTLQTARLIRQGHGSITVTDRAGLKDAACECYSRIRRIYQRLLPGTYA